MNKRTFAAILALAAMGLAACTGGAGDAAQLEEPGVSWTLVTLDGQAPLAGTTITATFSEGGIGGSSGCNSYFGTYTAEGSSLRIEGIGMTEMACLDPAGVMDQEQAYLQALSEVTGYRLGEGQLEMLDSTGAALLVYARQAAAAPPDSAPELTLEGTSWTLMTLIDGPAASSVIEGTTITLRFEGGQVSGSAGCNDYGGPYTLSRGVLQIGPVAITEQACAAPTGVMEQEMQYIDILQSATIVELEATQLALRTDGAQALVFQPE